MHEYKILVTEWDLSCGDPNSWVKFRMTNIFNIPAKTLGDALGRLAKSMGYGIIEYEVLAIY